ncbi:MAG: hypothetical protein ACFFDC_01025 [Promethearchaeota archaeon]
MEINELQKWNIATQLNVPFNVNELVEQLSIILLAPQVKRVIHQVDFQSNPHYTPIPFKAVLLDFEGSPAVLMGLMVHDTIISYYVEDYQFLNEFYMAILEAITIVCHLPIFCFSVYEQQEIIRIYTTLQEQGFDVSPYEFITSVPLINLQKTKSESVAEAVFSTKSSVKFTGDPLFRNIKVIDKLFMTGRIDEILIHNRTCLLNESIILQRWVKYHLLSPVNTMRSDE